jgi:hypothetical protein
MNNELNSEDIEIIKRLNIEMDSYEDLYRAVMNEISITPIYTRPSINDLRFRAKELEITLEQYMDKVRAGLSYIRSGSSYKGG